MSHHTEGCKPEPRRGSIVWRDLNGSVVLAIGALHLAACAVVMPQLFSWSGLAIFLGMIWVSGGLGVTLGFHRLLTHRSFRTPKWLEYLLTTCGCIAWQGSPVTWVGVHRLHHKHSDLPEDPHSPKHGFTWSHVLWTLHKRIDGIDAESASKDLLRDPRHAWLHRYHWLPQLLFAAALIGAGWAIGGIALGLSWFVWGVALRTVVVYHGTWFVNSATHTWGYRNYKDSGDHSTNLWWVAVLSFGEGWHNNHHAHPRSAAHGLRWFELDPTWWMVRLLKTLGLARDIHLPSKEQMPAAQPKPNAVPPIAGTSSLLKVPMPSVSLPQDNNG